MNDEIAGITRADFQNWKHAPVTKAVVQFLADKRVFMERMAIDQWLGGQLTLQADQTMRGQIIELYEMAHLEFEAIANFYDAENQ